MWELIAHLCRFDADVKAQVCQPIVVATGTYDPGDQTSSCEWAMDHRFRAWGGVITYVTCSPRSKA